MNEPILAFTMDVVARLTGLSEPQLRRLDTDGIYQPSMALENRRQPYSRIYSFSDLVALKVIATLRKKSVPWPEITRAAAFLRALPGASWQSARLFVLRKRLYLSHDELDLATGPTGRQAKVDVLDLADIQAEMRRRVDQLRHRTDDQIGRVVVDRFLLGGEPVFAGTRIPVATIASLLRSGMTDQEILTEFPRLRPGDVALAREQAEEHALLAAG